MPKLQWIRPNICLNIMANLEDVNTLQAAIGEIVEAFKEETISGVVFGIVLSLFQCSIVRLEEVPGECGQRKIIFQHTPLLMFLPDTHATEPSTPGITAFVRLLVHSRGDAVQEAFKLMQHRASHRLPDAVSTTLIAKRGLFHKLPVEVCLYIGTALSIDRLIFFAMYSPSCWQAASEILRHTHHALDDRDNICRLTQSLHWPAYREEDVDLEDDRSEEVESDEEEKYRNQKKYLCLRTTPLRAWHPFLGNGEMHIGPTSFLVGISSGEILSVQCCGSFLEPL